MIEQLRLHEDAIAERIKTLRTKVLGLTQIKMAAKLKVSPCTLSLWETQSSHITPNLRMAIKLAVAFGVSLDYLFGFSDDVMRRKSND